MQAKSTLKKQDLKCSTAAQQRYQSARGKMSSPPIYLVHILQATIQVSLAESWKSTKQSQETKVIEPAI